MSFEQRKKDILKKKDKSFKGSVDREIQPLVSLINSKRNFYTTSSCSGRIMLIDDSGEKKENAFIMVSHKPLKPKIDAKDIEETLIEHYYNKVYFKMEPCILHVACKSFEDAIKLVEIARNAGWKKSGVISKNNIAELISTESLSLPIGLNGFLIVDQKYMAELIKEANEKLKRTFDKIKRLSKELKNKID